MADRITHRSNWSRRGCRWGGKWRRSKLGRAARPVAGAAGSDDGSAPSGSKGRCLTAWLRPKNTGITMSRDIDGIADLCKPAVAKRRDSPHTWAPTGVTANMTDIKPDLPWSIKGVTADVRARAKVAAKRDGLTMGAWLSQAIETRGRRAAGRRCGGAGRAGRYRGLIWTLWRRARSPWRRRCARLSPNCPDG